MHLKVTSVQTMRVVGLSVLVEFVQKHTDAEKRISAWLKEVKSAGWSSPQDIRNRYSSASFLPNSIVIFNIKGNHYRVVVKVAFKTEVVLVQWAGSHADYAKQNFD